MGNTAKDAARAAGQALKDVRHIIEWVQADPEHLTALDRRRSADAVWRVHLGQGLWSGPMMQFAMTQRELRRSPGVLETIVEPVRTMIAPIAKGEEINRAGKKRWAVAISLGHPVPPGQETHMWVSFDAEEGTYERILAFPWPIGFLIQFAGLLERHGRLLRLCGNCAKVFIRTKRQEYCTTSCAQRVRSQRWYEAHRAEAQEKRRAGYVEKQRRRTGAPRLKVRRRLS